MKNDFGSAFLRAEDLIHDGVWSEKTFTIKEGHPPGTLEIRDGKETLDKEALSFHETDQYLVMGKLNWRLLRYATGIETKDACVGRKVTLYASRGDWFGERGVAAIRVRVPKGGVRPNVKKNVLGTDITGERFAPPPPPPPPPKATPADQINACQTAGDLRGLLAGWAKAAPIGTRAEKWVDIINLARAKIDAENWQTAPGDLMEVVQDIIDEAQYTLENPEGAAP